MACLGGARSGGGLGLFIAPAQTGAVRLVIITGCAVPDAHGAVAYSAGQIRRQVLEVMGARANCAPDSRHIAECGYLVSLVATSQTAYESLGRGIRFRACDTRNLTRFSYHPGR